MDELEREAATNHVSLPCGQQTVVQEQIGLCNDRGPGLTRGLPLSLLLPLARHSSCNNQAIIVGGAESGARSKVIKFHMCNIAL